VAERVAVLVAGPPAGRVRHAWKATRRAIAATMESKISKVVSRPKSPWSWALDRDEQRRLPGSNTSQSCGRADRVHGLRLEGSMSFAPPTGLYLR
jgi:hypothetical protein